MIIDGPWPKGTLVQFTNYPSYDTLTDKSVTLWAIDNQKYDILPTEIPIMWLGYEIGVVPPDFTNLSKANRIFVLHKGIVWYFDVHSDLEPKDIFQKWD